MGKRGRPKGLPKSGGRAKGTPNKVPSAAREAWCAAWEVTAPKVGGWLNAVAEGKPEDADGPARAPDPAKAAELAIRMAEYHVPRLAQQQVTGADGEPLTVVIQTLSEVADGEGQLDDAARGTAAGDSDGDR